jgi:hypothetical protein
LAGSIAIVGGVEYCCAINLVYLDRIQMHLVKRIQLGMHCINRAGTRPNELAGRVHKKTVERDRGRI